MPSDPLINIVESLRREVAMLKRVLSKGPKGGDVLPLEDQTDRIMSLIDELERQIKESEHAKRT